jgi:hypothetical protein
MQQRDARKIAIGIRIPLISFCVKEPELPLLAAFQHDSGVEAFAKLV